MKSLARFIDRFAVAWLVRRRKSVMINCCVLGGNLTHLVFEKKQLVLVNNVFANSTHEFVDGVKFNPISGEVYSDETDSTL